MNIKAYAKINLGLHIVGTRPDGFHNIETIFHRVGLHDEITLHAHNTIVLQSSHPDLPLDEKNLCWQAVELLRAETGISAGAAITITKHIPLGAGLGGGSSNAAAVLINLPALWNIQVNNDVLRKIALQLGSDVPFFLGRMSAFAEGRGEILSYFPLRIPFWIVVVTPPIHVSTAWAYRALSDSRNGEFPDRPRFQYNSETAVVNNITSFRNDFEEVVLNRYPEIGKAKKLLDAQGAVFSLLSGSGASVFGLFDSREKAERLTNEAGSRYFTHITEPNFTVSE